jgi:hypothetical protein
MLTESNSKRPGHFRRACIPNTLKRNTLLSCVATTQPILHKAPAHDEQRSSRHSSKFNTRLILFPTAHHMCASSASISSSPETKILLDASQQASPRFESDQLFDLSHLHPTTNNTPIGLSSGTIFMKSKVSPVVPVEFSVSGTCLAVSPDFACLAIDVGQNLIHSHHASSERWPPFERYQETITTRMGDVEFRVTLDLLTDRKMGNAEFAELMGLVVGTVRGLFKAAQSTGFESAIFRGVYSGVAFKVWWTWYSFVNGLAGPCQGAARIPSHRKEL